jgi:small subunit ribosomal protein S5
MPEQEKPKSKDEQPQDKPAAKEAASPAPAGNTQQRQGRRGRGGPDHGRPQRRDRSKQEDSDDPFKETVVRINRNAKVVKGGRRFSFSALVVVGDRQGSVGVGLGKAPEVPQAVEKGVSGAKKNLVKIAVDGTTIPHEVWGKFGSSRVILVPASKGTGVIAGACVRAVIEAAGISDILTKVHGATNSVNLVKATMNALTSLKTMKEIERLRGVTI